VALVADEQLTLSEHLTWSSVTHSCLIIWFVTRLTRRVWLVKQKLLTLPEHLSSARFVVGFVLPDLLYYVYVLLIVVCPFVLLAMVLPLLLWFADYEYPFGIFKFFFKQWWTSMSPILTKQTIISHLNSLNTKNHDYDLRNLCPDLWQA
jgi:hypothetical protein